MKSSSQVVQVVCQSVLVICLYFNLVRNVLILLRSDDHMSYFINIKLLLTVLYSTYSTAFQ